MQRKTPHLQWIAFLSLLPGLYLLSFIPLAWAHNRKYLPGSDGMNQAIHAYSYPVEQAYRHGPDWVVEPLRSYGDFLRKL